MKWLGVDSVGKSALELRHDSTLVRVRIGDNVPKYASKKTH